MLSVVEGIKAAARRSPLSPALVTGFRIVNYDDLLGAVARISNHLADRGIRPGTKAFFNIGDPDIRLIVTIACLHCGIVPFILKEIGDLTDEVDCDLIIGMAPLREDGPKPDILLDSALLVGGAANVELREFPQRPDDDILYIGATTGTTGRRKLLAELCGVAYAKGSLGEKLAGSRGRQVSAGDRCFSTLGDLTKYGFGMNLQNLSAGAANIRAPNDNLECLKAINVMAVTHLGTTPDTANVFMDYMEKWHARCPSVRSIRLSGSLFHPALIARLESNFSARLVVGYGTSEVGRITAGRVSAATFEAGYVGEPHPEIQIVSAGTPGNPQPVVIVNEGARYAPYYSKGRIIPVLPAPYVLPDLGYMKDGSLYLVGRDDEVFNADGNKVAFSVIENALRPLPGIADVGVVAGSMAGEPLGLLVAASGKGRLDLAALTNAVCQTLQSTSVRPHVHVFQVSAVPRNSLGKVDRNAVAVAYKASVGSPGKPAE